jgi:hypothetical protein
VLSERLTKFTNKIFDMDNRRHIRWKLGALAGLVVVIVTFIPQAVFWVHRGTQWQGSFAIIDYDEVGYSAYLNSIIEGRPRRNNPYTGPENTLAAATVENLYSIQFVPPYAIAIPARIIGISASTVFILLLPIMALISTLAVFWLLVEVTANSRVAAVGVLIVLLCGLLAAEYPFAPTQSVGTFAFLRRYLPAVPFPLFFIFCIFVWRAFRRQTRDALLWSIAAGVVFGLLVYSYFYLWTAAAAWLFCLTAVWIVARPAERTHILKCISILGTVALSALLPLFHLLFLRAETIDRTHGLALTRTPDVLRFTEIIGAIILLALAWGARRGIISWTSPAVLFAASSAMAPFVVFNQQVITGHSLQPFHYEQFILNYLILIGFVITDQLLWKFLLRRRLFPIALALVVGTSLSVKSANVNSPHNLARDEAIPVFKRIEEDLARNPNTGAALFDQTLLAASAPTSCSVPLLWSPYTYTYGTISTAEDSERLFQYFYYLGVAETKFKKLLEGDSLFSAALFGVPRVNPTLTQKFEPISPQEIREQAQAYSTYTKEFSRDHASRWPLSYVILSNGIAYDLSNLDRWYQRDAGERIGSSILYRVRLRPGNE